MATQTAKDKVHRAEKICVIGGGLAGLSSAWSLVRRGFSNVQLFEAEPQLCAHASLRNAAIFRPLQADPFLTELAWRNRALIEDLESEARRPLLTKTAILFLDDRAEQLEAHLDSARHCGIPCEEVPSPKERWPALLSSLPESYQGLYCPAGGVLDVSEVAHTLRRRLISSGVRIALNEKVRLSCSGDGRGDGRGAGGEVLGVVTRSGETVEASQVVLAAGGQTGACLSEVGLSAPLLPLQRHLAVLNRGRTVATDAPIIWQLRPEIYFRREIDGVLVSPCDESPCPSGTPHRELSALFPLGGRLAKINHGLSMESVRQFGAWVRTKSVDGRPIIGPDHRLKGLHWLGGLGGTGMSTALAAGELLARLLDSETCATPFCPQRFELGASHPDGKGSPEGKGPATGPRNLQDALGEPLDSPFAADGPFRPN